MTALLEVEDLTIRIGGVPIVEAVSFMIDAGETLALVGESSSGKTVTALALMRLLSSIQDCEVTGRAILQGAAGEKIDLISLSERRMTDIRGCTLSMIFQEPMSSLNPVHKVGAQIAETLVRHKRIPRSAARDQAVGLLAQVGIPDPKHRAHAYPHQLSGGMRQRVMIAIALACRPAILIADEPTTALDVTIQAEILDLLKSIQKENGMAMLFITHNLGIVEQIADRVLVLYSGQVVENAPVSALRSGPLMPYTLGLMRSLPRLETVLARGQRLTAIPGQVPEPHRRPQGCVFHPRCPHVRESCKAFNPPLEQIAPAHFIRCSRWREVTA
jgi:oligopeptide transport system ATP-binding protein